LQAELSNVFLEERFLKFNAYLFVLKSRAGTDELFSQIKSIAWQNKLPQRVLQITKQSIEDGEFSGSDAIEIQFLN
jgi:hypothetical protein